MGLRHLQIFDQLDGELSLRAAISRLRDNSDYDLIVLDLNPGDASGVNALVQLREEFPKIPVIVFSGDESEKTIRAAVDCGIVRYITKGESSSEISKSFLDALSSYSPIDAAIGYEKFPWRPSLQSSNSGILRLMQRQEQVLERVMQHRTNLDVASSMGIAEGTVKTHVSALLQLFHVHSRGELAQKGRDLGFG